MSQMENPRNWPCGRLWLGSILSISIYLLLSIVSVNAEPVTIKFATINHMTENWIAAAEMFHKANPDIRIEFEWVTGNWDGLNQKLTVEAAAGVQPDIARIGLSYWSGMQYKGMLSDMMPLLKRSNFRWDEYFPVISAYGQGGTMYGLSSNIYVLADYLNKDHFNEAGVKLPSTSWETGWTWEDYRQVAQKLTQRNADNKVVRIGKAVNFDMARIIQYIWQNGGEWMTADERKPLINMPAAVEALDWLQKLVFVDRAAIASGGYNDFRKGTLAIQTSGLWVEWINEINYGLAPLPRGKAGAATALFADPYVMLKGTKHPVEAMKVLEFFLSPEVAKLFIERQHIGIPLHRKTVLSMLPSMFGDKITLKEKMVWVDAISYARNVPWTPFFTEMANVIRPELVKLSRNEASAQVVADEIARRTSGVLADMSK